MSTTTRVRKRIEHLEEDLQILEHHEPELAEQLREMVCAGSETTAIYDILDDIQNETEELRSEIGETIG